VGQEQLGPSYFFTSLVLGPLNSLVWYVPSLRYTRGLGWRIHCGVEVTELSTNKQHIINCIISFQMRSAHRLHTQIYSNPNRTIHTT
jgi:hypothetical protein